MKRLAANFLYCYRSIVKMAAIFFFGLGAVIMGVLIMPPLRLLVHPVDRFKQASRIILFMAFRLFVAALSVFGGIRLTVDDRKRCRAMRSKVVAANHPSLLDVVILLSLFPNADCIVNGSLSKSPLTWVIHQLYIVNSLDFNALMEKCRQSLASGTNILIFPEGTRTPHSGTVPFKRGAARIAWEADADIQPLYIGGNEKYGLGKHDPLFSYNKDDVYRYNLVLLAPIPVQEYKELEPQIAARRMTEQLHAQLAAEALRRDGRPL